MRRTMARALVCAAALVVQPAAARANGAFPDSLSILLPVPPALALVLLVLCMVPWWQRRK